jgi:hypothetical protein
MSGIIYLLVLYVMLTVTGFCVCGVLFMIPSHRQFALLAAAAIAGAFPGLVICEVIVLVPLFASTAFFIWIGSVWTPPATFTTVLGPLYGLFALGVFLLAAVYGMVAGGQIALNLADGVPFKDSLRRVEGLGNLISWFEKKCERPGR